MHLPSLTYVQPTFPLLLVLTAASVISWRGRQAPNWLRFCVAVALILFCLPAFAWIPLRFLEGPYPPGLPPMDGVEAVVVLASEVLPVTANRLAPTLAFDTYQRTQHAALVYQSAPSVPLLTTGKGSVDPPSYAASMKVALEQFGVPADRIWVEEQSRSTYENALYSGNMLRGRGIHKIALVTEAYHMYRAERCFRKQGLEVIPAPCCFRSDPDDGPAVLPSYRAIAWNEDSLHELLGILWYKIRGRI